MENTGFICIFRVWFRQVYTGLCVYSGFGLDRFRQVYVYIQGLVYTGLCVYSGFGIDRIMCIFRVWFRQVYMYIQGLV